MWPSGETEAASVHDRMAGAWLVETIVIALVLLLVGKLYGVAITLYSFAVSLALATALMLLGDFVRRRFAELTKKRRR